MNQYEMKRRAYQSDLRNRALQVLLYLIDRSNKEGTCFPAISTIGRELHISISTVKRALAELVDAGFIVKESRYRENMGQTSNLYTVTFPVKNTDIDSAEKQEITFESLAQEKCVEQQEQGEDEKKENPKRKDNKSSKLIKIFSKNKMCYRGHHWKHCLITEQLCSKKVKWTGVGGNLIPP